MAVLSADEIRAGIEKVKAEYAKLPEYSTVGDRNWAIRDAIIEALEKAAKADDEGELDDYWVEEAAEALYDVADQGDPKWMAAEALEWITGDRDAPFSD